MTGGAEWNDSSVHTMTSAHTAVRAVLPALCCLHVLQEISTPGTDEACFLSSQIYKEDGQHISPDDLYGFGQICYWSQTELQTTHVTERTQTVH